MSTNNSNYPINLNDNPDYPEQEYILVASPRTPFTDPSSEPPPIVRLGRRRRRIVYPELRGLHPVRRPKPVLYYQRSRPLRSRPHIVEDIVPYGLPINVVPPQIDDAAEAVGEDIEEEERLKEFRSRRPFTYTLPRRRGRPRSIRDPPKSHLRPQSSQRLIDAH